MVLRRAIRQTELMHEEDAVAPLVGGRRNPAEVAELIRARADRLDAPNRVLQTSSNGRVTRRVPHDDLLAADGGVTERFRPEPLIRHLAVVPVDAEQLLRRRQGGA